MSKDKNCREDIVKACKRLFLSGDMSISVEKVAKEANVSKSLVFYFFKNKENLFYEFAEDMINCIADQLEVIQQKPIKEDQKIIEMLGIFLENTKKGGSFAHFMFKNCLDRNERFMKLGNKIHKRFFDIFHSVILNGIRNGTFKKVPPVEATLVILRVFDSLALDRALRFSQAEKITSSENIFDFIIFLLKDDKTKS